MHHTQIKPEVRALIADATPVRPNPPIATAAAAMPAARPNLFLMFIFSPFADVNPVNGQRATTGR